LAAIMTALNVGKRIAMSIPSWFMAFSRACGSKPPGWPSM